MAKLTQPSFGLSIAGLQPCLKEAVVSMTIHRPRILLLGAKGQVGWELQRSLAPLGELIALDRAGCDLGETSVISTLFERVKPNIVVNAAAYTAVDKAEQDAATADAINHIAVATLADLAKKNNALFVHYSTDYVFDGSKDGKYAETDAPNPVSVYGSTKLKGERAITATNGEYLIFRTSWVFASRGANFAKTMLKLATERESLSIVADQFGAPTSAELIADVTAHAIRESLAGRTSSGIYHLAASGETSWYDYASYVIHHAAEFGVQIKAHTLKPIPASEYPLPAQRPVNSRLDTNKLCDSFNLSLPRWEHHVHRMLTELLGK